MSTLIGNKSKPTNFTRESLWSRFKKCNLLLWLLTTVLNYQRKITHRMEILKSRRLATLQVERLVEAIKNRSSQPKDPLRPSKLRKFTLTTVSGFRNQKLNGVIFPQLTFKEAIWWKMIYMACVQAKNFMKAWTSPSLENQKEKNS